ncbi:hypothetical protein QKT49_gp406 [Acanthamoeba castellanii medusavirus]|uniref:Uncharacterized protein n=1 Tax=Acanthamoeba castellanii medusavirus J1 TaxID=3114988 RepID=A0A3T1CWZ7_9VIRU|nr:hypothetical protein QKT49_gp406 [Acanthamoeba castellanii medusavirus]BBI30357.1 hypothetical protein [Acanthamoeba castellanii medusavirus J1]
MEELFVKRGWQPEMGWELASREQRLDALLARMCGEFEAWHCADCYVFLGDEVPCDAWCCSGCRAYVGDDIDTDRRPCDRAFCRACELVRARRCKCGSELMYSE